MITKYTSFECLAFETDLIAKCFLSGDDDAALTNALTLSMTSKVFYYMINSYSFFKQLVEKIEPNHPGFTAEKIENVETSFLDRCFELRDVFLQKFETFSIIPYSTLLASKAAIEIFSVDDGIKNYLLKEGSLSQPTKIAEDLPVAPIENQNNSLRIEHSENFLVINNPLDSDIYVYTSNGKTCLAKYEIKEKILEFTIQNNLLFVLKSNNTTKILVFDLELLSEPNPIGMAAIPITSNSSFPLICISQKDLICVHNITLFIHQAYALPITQINHTKWIKGPLIQGDFYFILPQDDHFIEVNFIIEDKKKYMLYLTKINILGNTFQRKELVKRKFISSEIDIIKNICLFHNRIFLDYQKRISRNTTIISYDILTGKIAEFSPVRDYLKGCFLTGVKDVYYLQADIRDQWHLTTLTYPIQSSLDKVLLASKSNNRNR